MVDLRSWVVREVPSSYHASLFFLKVVQGFF